MKELSIWECIFGKMGTKPTGSAIVVSESKEKAFDHIKSIHSPEMKMEDIVFYEHGIFEGCTPFYDDDSLARHEPNS